MDFTVHHDRYINMRVERDLALIRDFLVERLPSISAMILVGGFGRGEGSVLINARGDVTPVNDYDIIVVHRGPIDRAELARQREVLAQLLGIWLLDLIPLEESKIPTLPLTQLYYDSSVGGYVFYGDDAVMGRWPRWRAQDIPWKEGRKVLFNRFISILEAYSDDFLSRSMTAEESFKLANQTSKGILACCDALLILSGHYEHLYRERPRKFAQLFQKRETEIALVRQASEFKLRPSMPPAFDALSFWQRGIVFYAETLREFLERFYQLPAFEWEAFEHFYVSVARRSNWSGYARDVVRRLLGRLPAYGAILHLEMAALNLILARGLGEQEEFVRLASYHLERSGCRAPLSNDVSWEAARQALVKRWYEIKH